MGKSRRDRARRPARRTPYLQAEKRILVVCEGKVTEKQYIDGYRQRFRRAALEIEFVPAAGDPKLIVEEALSRRTGSRFDEVWCVFDRDDHTRFMAAIDQAQAQKLNLAVSNPCFELWLLLHFRESPGAQHRDDLRRMLRDKYLPGYEKHLDFADLVDGIEPACQRAVRLEREAEERGDALFDNPSTTVHRLIASMAPQAM